MKKWKLFLIIAAILAAVAALVLRYGPSFGIYLIPPTPEEYVRQALSFADQGIYARGEEWSAARSAAMKKAADCRSYEETYPVIQEALKVAGGKHSAIRSPEDLEDFVQAQALPECSLENGILTLRLPPYSMDSGKSDAYTSAVLTVLRDRRAEIRGVILDLRDNTGGDMGPMVAAVSPLLPDGTVLQFDLAGSRQDVTLSGGVVAGGGSRTEAEALKKLAVPVAVLQNGMTASSGEAVLLCFKGMDQVRFFGSDTAGYCSVNNVRTLYDGARIQLTVGSDVDRTGRIYCEDPIPPDVVTDRPAEDAAAWILQNS